ncbi:MAG: GAF domain-containing sensor histidine kinase [Anaerolineae bacterium]|nr:GAF domain-containing sensor histidine kinase [Thermoflexus sp.]MDW8064843.1 GAF domain-containing sensor histidine kinase [Anaerolineae bacterium]
MGGILALGLCGIYALLLRWQHRGAFESLRGRIVLYGGLGLLWQGIWTIAAWEGGPPSVRFLAWNLAGVLLSLLPFTAWFWISAFLGHPLSRYAIGGIGLAGGIALIASILPYHPATGKVLMAWWQELRWPGDPTLASWGIREGLWGIGIAIGLGQLGGTYLRTARPLHRNRLAYGLLGAVLTATGEGLSWTHRGEWIMLGWALRAAGMGVIASLSRFSELPSLQRAGRWLLIFTLSWILEAGLIGGVLAGFWLARGGRLELPIGAELAFAAVGIAWVTMLVGRPIHKWLQRHLMPSVEDPAALVRRYAQSISNLLDIQQVAHAAFAVLQQTFGLQQGMLLLFEDQPDGWIEARVIPGMGKMPLQPGRFAPNSPILGAWQKGCPLTQYQIDFGAAFQHGDPEERRWIQGLGAELFIPIRSQAALLGCLALGARGGVATYSPAEVDLLASIAEQTATVLQNIRLVEDLRRLNIRLAELNEDLMRTARRLQKLDRAKTHFIQIASHELRTPLTHICGYLDLLAETLEEQSEARETQERILQGLRRSANRLEEIVSAMLDISQINAEAFSIYPISFQIPTLVRMALEPFREAIAERNQNLIVEVPEALPVIYGDLTRLVQALRHIVQNAIKFTPDGGTIQIRARSVPPEEAGGTAHVEIAVQDTGIGIDVEDQALIFEKFYRVGPVELHSTGSVKFKGAGPGLGLPIARGIIEAHGGRIWVESPGYDEARCPGSTFYIWIPVIPRSIQTGQETHNQRF